MSEGIEAAVIQEELAKKIGRLWMQVKPSPDAQKIRARLSTAFDGEESKDGWLGDNLPDHVWSLVDIAVQAGIGHANAEAPWLACEKCGEEHEPNIAEIFKTHVSRIYEQAAEAERRASAAECRIAELEAAGRALYDHAVDVRIHQDGFYYAWWNKFSPDSRERLKTLRIGLMAACAKWRAAMKGRKA
jgi:hypothetical protein